MAVRMPGPSVDETRITGRLPNVDIEITHRRTEDAERVTVSLVATPSFEAFAQAIEVGNPLLAWAQFNPFAAAWLQMAQAAWAPWLGGAPTRLVPKRADEG
jgi:hypothetical protein